MVQSFETFSHVANVTGSEVNKLYAVLCWDFVNCEAVLESTVFIQIVLLVELNTLERYGNTIDGH